MMKSKNFSGLAKALYVLGILLCVGTTTYLIIKYASKNPTIETSNELSDETRRGEDILNTPQELSEHNNE